MRHKENLSCPTSAGPWNKAVFQRDLFQQAFLWPTSSFILAHWTLYTLLSPATTFFFAQNHFFLSLDKSTWSLHSLGVTPKATITKRAAPLILAMLKHRTMWLGENVGLDWRWRNGERACISSDSRLVVGEGLNCGPAQLGGASRAAGTDSTRRGQLVYVLREVVPVLRRLPDSAV